MFHEDEHIFHETELTFRLTDTPTVQESALNYLLRNADEPFTESQVRSALDTPRTSTHVALQSLVRQHLVVSEHVGRTGVYTVSTRDPLIRQLKIAQAVRRVQSALRPVEGLVDLAVLFGSASRGEDRGSSDVDVLIVTAATGPVLDVLSPQVWLQPVMLTPGQHMALIAENATLISETEDGIRILERR